MFSHGFPPTTDRYYQRTNWTDPYQTNCLHTVVPAGEPSSFCCKHPPAQVRLLTSYPDFDLPAVTHGMCPWLHFLIMSGCLSFLFCLSSSSVCLSFLRNNEMFDLLRCLEISSKWVCSHAISDTVMKSPWKLLFSAISISASFAVSEKKTYFGYFVSSSAQRIQIHFNRSHYKGNSNIVPLYWIIFTLIGW